MVFSEDSLQNKTESIIIFLTEFTLLSKIGIHVFKKDQFEDLIISVKKNFFIHKTYLSTENREIIHSNMKLLKQLSNVYAIFVTLGIIFYFDISPLITSGNTEGSNERNVTAVSERKLPAPLWVPVHIETSNLYHTFYAFFLLIGHSLFLVVGSVQVVLFVFVICLRCQFELLSDALRSLTRNVRHRLQTNTGNINVSSISMKILFRLK